MFLFLTEASAGGSGLILWLVIMIAIFYLFVIGPEKKNKKRAEELKESLSVGDDITTIGGMIGKVVQVTQDTVTFETGEDRVRIQIKKSAISSSAKMEAAEAASASQKKSIFGKK